MLKFEKIEDTEVYKVIRKADSPLEQDITIAKIQNWFGIRELIKEIEALEERIRELEYNE